MTKLTAAQRLQNKANLRNFVKGTLSVLVCMLNKDFREDIVDYTIASAKSNVVENKADLKNIELYPAFTIARRAILNMLDTVQLNICIDVEHLHSDALKGHLQKSIDLALTASGWSKADFDALTNYDMSAMTISTKIAHVLAHPLEESLHTEGMGILLTVAQPFIETYQRMGEGLQEVTEQTAEEINKLPKDEKYVRLHGVLVPKANVKEFIYQTTVTRLEEELFLSNENIKQIVDKETGHYTLPEGTMEARAKYIEADITFDEYNKIIADLIAGK